MKEKKEKPQPTPMDTQYNQCKGHLTKVYETERSVFMRCKKGHSVNGVYQHPVFMIRKEAKV